MKNNRLEKKFEELRKEVKRMIGVAVGILKNMLL